MAQTDECPTVTFCPDCGYEDGSFACKIRHVHLNTGDAKAARDGLPPRSVVSRHDIHTTS